MMEQTAYRVSTSENEGIVEIVLEGEVTGATITSLHQDAIKAIRGHKALALLCDIRNLKGYSEDYASAYFRVRKLPPDVKFLPAAIVSHPMGDNFASFYETTASNAGQTLRWFYDIAAARDWLKQEIAK